jgi:nicotinamide mononucleotide adenylyltransferase
VTQSFIRAANVLTYFERVEIITQMLLDVGVSRATFAWTPFPIDEPVLLPDFISTGIPCLTTVYDEWNLEKNRVLSTLGYQTIVLYERAEKAIKGSEIRQSILHGHANWLAQVPEATARAVDP